jgi:hypothetical protein
VATAVFYLRRAFRLARNGVEVVANVTRIGRLETQGLVRVDYEYWCLGLLFRKAMSCLRAEAEEYWDGTRQLILDCDPAKPGRSMKRSDVWCNVPCQEEKPSQ